MFLACNTEGGSEVLVCLQSAPSNLIPLNPDPNTLQFVEGCWLLLLTYLFTYLVESLRQSSTWMTRSRVTKFAVHHSETKSHQKVGLSTACALIYRTHDRNRTLTTTNATVCPVY